MLPEPVGSVESLSNLYYGHLMMSRLLQLRQPVFSELKIQYQTMLLTDC